MPSISYLVGADGTLKAVEFFTKNYKMIAKKFGKSRYCFAIPISRINNSIELIESKDIIDLTDVFFNSWLITNEIIYECWESILREVWFYFLGV